MHETTCEAWLPSPSYPGYEVSDLGQIRSIDRVIETRQGPRRRRGQIIAPYLVGRGYLGVQLGRDAREYVHTLVAEAWIGPRPPGEEVRHDVGGMLDNRPENLSYGTSSENKRDSVRHGTHDRARRTACPREHPLVAPNLIAAEVRRGWRACLACSRARGTVRVLCRAGVEVTPERFKAIADEKYEGILAAA